tara:strand:+ start:902 stop:1360 length:459 start_codon:yes stop_codon:yes gene_type:complete
MKNLKILLVMIFVAACSSGSGDNAYGYSDNNSNDKSDNNNNQSSATTYNISVTSSGMSDYKLSGKDRSGDVNANDPSLTFKVGDQITFSVNAYGHPFYLKTKAGTGTGNLISGLSNNGTTSGSIVWKPSSAGTYYYVCSLHGNMMGAITITS